ncbi:ubiquinone biosynthesis regulatory protein kinase UbiB [Bermanella marisrubri]|uniref:Probable protein kinase UbiB n=1 Tax=Bermanella marisrubri TaxID=207949 RepID=Q1N205_9GAMM|nr:ubiquinone biosynthesis regulatory protein kinase UbiB [Bermanella marisrubri]EAT12359.1 2-polyprenylphenol 6-hydroxylase [Bermanella marisrubri]QIZ85442.1 ubiquinone biosynthesis regulatory protein kinase UbiB [Bermanella marisrubri]
MQQLRRLITIAYVFIKYRLDDFVPVHLLPWYLRLAFYLAPWRLNPLPKRMPKEKRLRLALIKLGPIFIKFGQILSTRRDLLSPKLAAELAKLQDKVPPFSSRLAKNIIEQALEDDVSKIFARFDTDPLASASIAQVHAAQLLSGEEVVVKVIRPNIERTIEKDIRLMLVAARLFQRYARDGKRLKPIEVVEDYRHTIFGELDLMSEAANCAQLRRNFQDSPLLYVPDVYWDWCRENVMVQERIYGTPIGDVETLISKGTNMKVLAERGVEIFFRQVFQDSFFHADMHPGNIFVDCQDPESPRYIAIDCGIVGTLSEVDQDYLARNLLAFFNQDYHEVARLHVESGWVGAETRINEFEGAIRSVCEPIFEKPLEEISFGQLLLRLFQVARRYNMEVQPQLVLLQKTLLNIEGLGRQLYPQLDLWSTAKPYLESWMKRRMGPQAIWQEIKRQAPAWIAHGPQMPELIRNSLISFNQYPQHQAQLNKRLENIESSLDGQAKGRKHRAVGTLVAALGLVSLHTPYMWDAQASSSLIALGIAWILLRG